jgi:hypothetical protein
MNILLFLVQFLQPVKFHVVGDLSLGEFLLPILFLLTVKRTLRLIQIRLVRVILVLALLYFASLVLSDIFRETPSVDYLRGWARVGVFLVSLFIYLGALWQRPAAILATLAGSIASAVPTMLIVGLSGSATADYKWVYGAALALLTMLVAGSLLRTHPVFSLCLVGGVSALSFLMDFRSLAGVAFLGLIALLMGRHSARLKLSWSLKKTAITALAFVLFAGAVLAGYEYAAPRGMLGREAQAKFEMQAGYVGFSILSGRSELYFTMPKIIQSPVVGWGSWPKDLEYVLAVQARISPGRPLEAVYATSGLIPTHSYIFGGWLEAGVLGGLFWLVVLWISCRNLVFSRMPATHAGIWAAFIFSTLMLTWDLLFSPFGGGSRVDAGFIVAWQCVVAAQIGFSRVLQLKPRLKS